MATVKYNGQDAEIVTTPQVFEEPKEMLAWNGNLPTKRMIVAILPNGTAIDTDKNWLRQCAFIPIRRATNRELAKWLAQGNGEVKYSSQYAVKIKIEYGTTCDNDPCDGSFKVRKWDDTEWHEPTIDYMGIEEAK